MDMLEVWALLLVGVLVAGIIGRRRFSKRTKLWLWRVGFVFAAFFNFGNQQDYECRAARAERVARFPYPPPLNYQRQGWVGRTAGRDLCGLQLQLELTRTLLGPNHALLSVLIREHEGRSMPRRPRIITDTNRSFVRAGGCGRV